jgi:outer membrane protein OmpA-like peptidoglycan-associated protein
MFDAQLGFDWFPSGSQFGVGPMLGYLHVTQPDNSTRPSDASLLLFGLHVGYDLQERKKPILDRDGDGILDDVDKCPDDPEDKDGFEDQDGCPDNDNDQDTILDLVDQCPLVPEDKDGFLDEDGCPDPDNDKDGILDKADQCPLDPEDKDGFEDQDGCPDNDNDQDGIVDAKDLCPNEPETQNGYADQDGCPDEQQVRVVGDRIMLDDKVHFRTNSHIIRPLSYPLLDQLWKLISEHPEYTHVEIEGHADQRGDATFNKALSQRRAESVMAYLIKRGLDESRLSAVGYGSERPLVDQRSEYAWLLNRRVEFAVTREKKTTVTKDSAPKAVEAPAEGGSP